MEINFKQFFGRFPLKLNCNLLIHVIRHLQNYNGEEIVWWYATSKFLITFSFYLFYNQGLIWTTSIFSEARLLLNYFHFGRLHHPGLWEFCQFFSISSLMMPWMVFSETFTPFPYIAIYQRQLSNYCFHRLHIYFFPVNTLPSSSFIHTCFTLSPFPTRVTSFKNIILVPYLIRLSLSYLYHSPCLSPYAQKNFHKCACLCSAATADKAFSFQ